MSLFIKLDTSKEKSIDLLNAVERLSSGMTDDKIFCVNHEDFKSIPGSPFSYWVPQKIRDLFSVCEPFESDSRTAKVGLSTGDDSRFLRNWWEVKDQNKWITFPKGGVFSPFFTNFPAVVKWTSEIEVFDGSVIRNAGYYKKPGITWPLRARSFCPQVMPKNCIFSVRGYSAFVCEEELLSTLAIFSSKIFDYIYKTALGRFGFPEFIVGILQFLPWKNVPETRKKQLAKLAGRAWEIKKIINSGNEKSHYFVAPLTYLKKFGLEISSLQAEYDSIQLEIDEICYQIYGIDASLVKFTEFKETIIDNQRGEFEELVSWCFGILFGRYEITKPPVLNASEPFAQLPMNILFSQENLRIFQDSEDECGDLFHYVEDILNEIGFAYDDGVTRDYIRQHFFNDHLSYFSENKRDVCLYWPLQTVTGSYTLWVYIHGLNQQTLYTCVNDFVEPKLELVEQDLNSLRSRSARSSLEEKELEKLSDLAGELRDFRDELLRVAKFWKPNLNDGVQITAAPLWKLFQHKAWQTKLKETWESLEQGEYDWAHLACSIWPDRVLRKCHQDRSLAIAHDVEDQFWYEVEVPVKRGSKSTSESKYEWQPKPFTDIEISNLIKQIKSARAL